MELARFRCLTCGNPLSIALRRVPLPPPPDPMRLDHHRPNPPLLEPGTYAVDPAEHGRDRVAGTCVLSPGDLRGTRFVHELVHTGCWSLDGWQPCLACEGCGTLVASRLDDCCAAQETRLYPDVVLREIAGTEPGHQEVPFSRAPDWDRPGPPSPAGYYVPAQNWRRPELLATRWRARGLKSEVYRDDPPT